MLRVANKKSKAKKRQIRFPGLVSDARELGVHRNHLYLVLSDRRESESLLARYRELKSNQENQGTNDD